MICLVKGCPGNTNHAERIITALSSCAVTNFSKRTLVLQMTEKTPVENILMGKRLESMKLHSVQSIYNDEGMDALFRRIEAGRLTGEQFSDCCLNVISSEKDRNSFDIATVSVKAGYINYLENNAELVGELLKNASIIYEAIFILADADDKEVVAMLEPMVDRILVCIPQAPKVDIGETKDVVLAVDNYNSLSCFTDRALAREYGNKFVYPVPYNISFIDACLNKFTIEFLSSSVVPGIEDDAYFFKEAIINLTGALFNMEAPELKERNFVFEKRDRKRR